MMAHATPQAAAPSGPATPPLETVVEFLVDADALIALGDCASASPGADALHAAIQQPASAYRAALAEAQARGKPPFSCPPPAGQTQLSLGDLISDLRAFPQANREMPVVTAFALVMTLRFACLAVAP